MAESDVVAGFKTFAQDRLLALLRPAPGNSLAKQTAYDEIRTAFAEAAGWPAELDAVEPGPAKTSCWLNRLHWVVADLVQAGVLEKSSGSDVLCATELGRGLLALTTPFRDTAQTRMLLATVATTPSDAANNAHAEDLLRQFRSRFPANRLADMDLKAYAIGDGGQDNFSWWLERGLADFGRYAPGSSRGHVIYRQKDGSYYLPPELASLTPEQAMREVAGWHAKLVQLGGSPTPEAADGEEFAKSKRSRTLKLLHSYFPNRFLPINSMNHMAKLLGAFGVPEAEIPEGPVARNRMLFKLYEEVAAPRGLTPHDFACILYDKFDPKGLKLDADRVRGAVRLFRLLYGETFASPRFAGEERTYKAEIIAKWQAVAQPADLERALGDGTEVAKAAELSAALLQPPSNFLNYRYQAAITGLVEPGAARIFVEAVTRLLASAEAEEGTPDISGFNARMRPLYDRLDPAPRVPASRTLPTLILMLSFPDRDLVIRSDAMSRAVQALAKRPFGFGTDLMTTEEYRSFRTFAEVLRQEVAGLAPADMVDVQGFIWGVFSNSELWFAGVTYDRQDMLDAFRQRGVYAVGFGGQDPLRTLVAGAAQLPTAERKARAQEIAAAAGKAEAAALTNFVELAARPGSIVLAKSTYAQGKDSVIRIRGAGSVAKAPPSFEEAFGHAVAVDWFGEADLRLRLKALDKVAGTLTPIRLAEALDILGAEIAAKPGNAGADDDAGTGSAKGEAPPVPFSSLAAQPTLPKNVILYGPPGTGKTHRALDLIAPQFGRRARTVTFHPGFAYEEFVEGLRPTSDNAGGAIRYDVVPGVFRQVCEAAAKEPEVPHLLVIDEINRANLASVLGELITVIEEDKRGRVSVILPYSKRSFSVPGNLWIVGTMNTADRSIALMDIALRRRFVFWEVPVNYEALRADFAQCGDPDVAGLDLPGILSSMNERLRYLLDREHQIGHAWLFNIRTLDDLRERFAGRILPLLAEYFFDDWSKACLVIGEDPTKARPTDLIRKVTVSQAEQARLFCGAVGDGANRVLYDPGTPETWGLDHFRKIAAQPRPVLDAMAADGNAA